MTVNAVGQQNSCMYTVVKSTAAGVVSGYALKYLWPIVKQENDIGKKMWLKTARKSVNNEKVDRFLSQDIRTPAQDTFIRMVENDKNSRKKVAFSFDNIAKEIEKLGGKDSVAGRELKAIIKNANETARSLARTVMSGYCFGIKRKRPVIPFLVAGAGIGFITGFIRNVAKTDV